MSLRPILAPLAGAAICFAISPWPGLAGRTAVLEQFVARAVSVSGTEDGGPIGIYIERWSSDEELDSLRKEVRPGDADGLLQVLHRQQSRVGVVLMPGVQGHGARARTRTPRNLLFAREVDTPAGRRVIVLSDEHLGLGEAQLDARKRIPELNLLEIRFGKDGAGVAKLAAPADVTWNPATGDLEVKNYAAKPARLIDVRSETR